MTGRKDRLWLGFQYLTKRIPALGPTRKSPQGLQRLFGSQTFSSSVSAARGDLQTFQAMENR